MTEPTPDKLEAILRRVQGLLATADHPGTDPTVAKTYRDKAEYLMFKYRIEESQAPSSLDQRASITPILRKMPFALLQTENYNTYWRLAYYCLKHVDALHTSGGVIDRDGERLHAMDVCGFESDIKFAELLFTSFSLAFASRMDARVDPSKSEQENAYALRMAGWDGGKVAAALWGVNDKPGRSKARRLFEAEARRRGENPERMLGQSNPMKSFREDYAAGFLEEMRSRLYLMRLGHQGGEIVLASRRTQVEDMFYGAHPELDTRNQSFDKPRIGGRDTCPKCKKNASGHCRDHPAPRVYRTRTRARSVAGYDQGRSAAASVDLGARAGRALSD